MTYEEETTADMDDRDMFEEFGEGFETDFDAVSEKAYEEAFNKEEAQRSGDIEKLQEAQDSDNPQDINEEEYEFDSVVGGRDKKPVMSLLNKGKLSKYEMDDLLNSLGE